jgi:quercetin dioxygenase-like cupin family protein
VAELQRGQAVALASLVEYQPGAIVSRTIVDRAQGTITLFALAAGTGLSEHKAPYEVFLYGLEGSAEVRLGGQPVRLDAGHMLLMPANQAHALRARTSCKLLLVMIRA